MPLPRPWTSWPPIFGDSAQLDQAPRQRGPVATKWAGFRTAICNHAVHPDHAILLAPFLRNLGAGAPGGGQEVAHREKTQKNGGVRRGHGRPIPRQVA